MTDSRLLNVAMNEITCEHHASYSDSSTGHVPQTRVRVIKVKVRVIKVKVRVIKVKEG